MEGERTHTGGMGDVPAMVLPSRRAAMDMCLAALATGPVLITGGPGVGKTWLATRLTESLNDPRSWVSVDVPPRSEPEFLLRHIARGLGLSAARDPRAAISDTLSEQSAEGVRWGLILDEAHLAPLHVLEEIRVLSNRLGRPDGFAAMILVAQTGLARRLVTRPLASFEARLAARSHLSPLDRDESDALTKAFAPDLSKDHQRLDLIHWQTGGNPRRLLQSVGAGRLAIAASSVRHHRADAGIAASPAPIARHLTAATPPPSMVAEPSPERPEAPEIDLAVTSPWPGLGSSKPPLRVEENLIEVGWAPEPDALSEDDFSEDEASAPVGTSDDAVVPVDDRYAAIQAWNEWTVNQGRSVPETADEIPAESDTLATAEEAIASRTPVPTDQASVWLEPSHSFAPFSQLFSRVKQANDSES